MYWIPLKKARFLLPMIVLSMVFATSCAKPKGDQQRTNEPSDGRVLGGSSGGSPGASGAGRNPHLSHPGAVETEGTFAVACGANHGQADFKITTPENWHGELFAILLNGTPGTAYVSRNVEQLRLGASFSTDPRAPAVVELLNNNPDPYLGIHDGLIGQGYKVMEIKYQSRTDRCNGVDGYYSLCCRQGLPASKAHNEELYESAIHHLNYDPANDHHRLIGFGISLGATQLESMAFASGKKFEKVGITGVLMGNSAVGCQVGQTVSHNGMGWNDFMSLADSLTLSGRGCSQTGGAALEYGLNYDFRYFHHRQRWDLGMFEGSRRTHFGLFEDPTLRDPLGLHGADRQVTYILRSREAIDHTTGGDVAGAAPEATTHHFYEGCGHESLFCSRGAALRDVMNYFDPVRRGLDVGPRRR